MPEISRFYGIIIRMYFKDHAPPHFHAEYRDRGGGGKKKKEDLYNIWLKFNDGTESVIDFKPFIGQGLQRILEENFKVRMKFMIGSIGNY
ncbi:MAG: DUF4160 domain-containing protein [Ignavibacteria bacterium]|nr:DUF4160 domain-containing protein [Ignavibacteria bacterium]